MRFMSGGLRAAALGGARFSPLSLSPFIWLDPSDLSTLKQERTGASATTPSVVDGVVGSMLDKASGFWHIARSDAGRPILRSSGGLFWLEFDGVDDGMNQQGAIDTVGPPFDRISALRNPSAQSGVSLLGGPRLFRSSGIRINASGVGVAEPADDVDYIIIERIGAGATDQIALDDGAFSAADDASADTNGGGQSYVGYQAPGDNEFANIRFYGNVSFDRALTDPEIAHLRTYLAAKQGRVL